MATGGDSEDSVLWNNVASLLLANSKIIAEPQYMRLVVIAAALAFVKRL